MQQGDLEMQLSQARQEIERLQAKIRRGQALTKIEASIWLSLVISFIVLIVR